MLFCWCFWGYFREVFRCGAIGAVPFWEFVVGSTIAKELEDGRGPQALEAKQAF
jgi:hypothetical protein